MFSRLARNRRFGVVLYVAALMMALSGNVYALDLRGTYWDRVAQSNHIDPYLLYSIALVESRVYRGRGAMSPWPWVINTPGGPFYSNSRKEAERDLVVAMARWPAKRIDVGLMQVCVGYHGDKVAQATDLLDPEVNVRTAAAILVDAMLSAPSDIEIAIGRYHSSDPKRARQYGREVLQVYRRIAPRRLASNQ